MKIAVMSDSHDHLGNLEKAVELAGEKGVDALIHCGDLCSPFVIDRLAAFTGPVHIVFGNNDGDRYTIAVIARKYPNISIHGILGTIETGEGKIAFTHRPQFAEGLAYTGEYTAVFHGHTHIGRNERIGNCSLVNPGEIMGLINEPGFVIFDLSRGSAEYITL